MTSTRTARSGLPRRTVLAVLAGLAATPTGRAGRLVAMPGNYLLGMGPRTPQALADLLGALHPGAAPRLEM